MSRVHFNINGRVAELRLDNPAKLNAFTVAMTVGYLGDPDSGPIISGYVASYLLPLSDALDGFRRLSPWYWAIGTQPVSEGVSAAWLALLLAITAALVVAGTVSIGRRDIRSA